QLALAVARRGAEGIELTLGVAEPSEHLAEGRERDDMGIAGEPIEERELHRRREQPLGLVLAVYLDEVPAERRERRRRGDLTTDPSGALPLRGHGSIEHELAVLAPSRVSPRV